MTRAVAAVVSMSFLTACAPSPAGPSGVTTTALLAAKPGTSPAPPHDMSFGPVVDPQDPVVTGYIDAASQPLPATISGDSAAGNVVVSAGPAPFTFTITDLAPLPPPATGTACSETEKELLRSAGILGAPVKGMLTLSADQDGSRSNPGPTLWLSISDVVDLNGSRWSLSGSSSGTYRPRFEGDAAGLTIVQETGLLLLTRDRKGKGSGNGDLTIGCRVDFAITVMPAGE